MRSGKVVTHFDEKKIDALFAAVTQCHLPGVAAGIAIGGVPVYRKGFGLANMELPVMLSPTIRMRIGSTTKHGPFAALAATLTFAPDGRSLLFTADRLSRMPFKRLITEE